MKRVFSHIAAAAGVLALVAGGAVAQPADPIPSTADGALDIPELWDCDRIEPEYAQWLEDGNAPEDWRYVGKTYRDVEDDELYSWQDWLDWADNAGCGAGFAEAGKSPTAIVGVLVAFYATGLIAALGGDRAISPG